MSGVLTGLRVLDLTFYLPGPYATWLLADLGLEIVKIENPAGGDPLRGLGPGGASPAGSVFFQALSRGKKSVTLDLKSPEGRDAFLRLAATADAVIEQFRPGVTRRLGIDYEAVRAVNPRAAYVSLTGYGQTGPLAGEAGHDLNYMARSGLLSLFAAGVDAHGGAPTDPEPGSAAVGRFPLPPIQFADLNGGSLAAVALLAGMLEARLSGEGRYFDLSMTDGLLGLMTLTAANFLAAGGRAPERSNLFLAGQEPFYDVYRTADGRLLAVGALEPKFWMNLCAVLAESDPEKKRPEVIGAGRDETARVFATKTAEEWLARLAGLDVCVAPVLSVAEALRGEGPLGGAAGVRERGMIVETPGAAQIGSPLRAGLSSGGPGVPANLELAAGGPAASAVAQVRPAPTKGEHNRDILLSLGYGESEIDDLARRGVISGKSE
jgi:crotonobetainyl-CoA:carnitine CoA-transferase CaiB-like acyl-CoA transferase